MANYTAGTAYLRVAPSMTGFHTNLRNELRTLNPEPTVPVRIAPKWTDRSNIELRQQVNTNVGAAGIEIPIRPVWNAASAAALRAALRGITPPPSMDVRINPVWRGGPLPPLPDQTVNVRVDKNSISGVGGMLKGLGKLFLGLVVPAAAVVGVSALTGAVGALTAAAVTSVGVLGLLPAILTAIGITTAAVKIGMKGFSDTLKETDPAKFAEGLAKLSPNARAAAVEIRALAPAWSALQLDVQDALFRGVGETIGELGSIYLPILRTGLTGTADALSYAAGGVYEFGDSARTRGDVAFIFGNTNTAVKTMSGSLDAVLRIFRDVVAVGSTFLPGLATGWAGAAQRAAEYVSTARESGALALWIQGGMNALSALGDLFGNVGATIGTVWRASQEAGGGFLQTMITATEQANAFLNTANGYGALVTIFTTLRDVVAAFIPGLVAFLNQLAVGIQILGPALPPIATAMSAILIVVSPLLPVLAQIVAVLGGALAQAIMVVVPLISSIATIIGQVLLAALRAVEPLFPILLDIMRQLVPPLTAVAQAIGQALVSALATLAPYLPPLVEQFGRIVLAAVPLVEPLVRIASTILNALLPVLPVLTGLFLRLIEDAVLPLLPPLIRLVEAILPGVVATINILIPVIEFLANILITVLVWAIEKIVIPVINILAGTLEMINEAYRTAARVVDESWRAISAFITDAWNGVIKPTWDALVGFIRGVLEVAFNVLWTTVRIAIGAIAAIITLAWETVIRPIWTALVDFVNGVLGPVFVWLQRNVVEPVWEAIRTVITAVWNFVRDQVWNPIVDFLRRLFGPAFETAGGVVTTVWTGMRDVINTAWGFIKTNVFDPLVTFVRDTIPGAFRAGVDVVGRVWDSIKRALRDPVQAVIDVVYNRGIVASWNTIADFVGLPGQKLAPFTLPQYAAGGPVMTDQVARIGEAGPEYVLSAPAVRNMGGIGAVDTMHRRAVERRTFADLQAGRLVEGADHDGPGISSSGFGGVRPHVARAGHLIKNKFRVATVGGVGGRPGPSDHPSGHALDFMTYRDMAKGDAVANYAVANARHLAIKYVIWRQRINSGGGWKAMADRGSITANHFDHPHVSFLRQGQAGRDFSGGGDPGGGGGFDPLGWVMGILGDLGGMLTQIPGVGPFVELAKGFGGKVFGAIRDFAVSKATAWGGGLVDAVGNAANAVATGVNVARWTPQVLAALAATGQNPFLVPTVLRRMAQESGGNPNAVNRNDINWRRGTPSVGLMQVIGPTFRAHAGQYRNTGPFEYGVSKDPMANIYASMRYALSRYGDLSTAYNRRGGYDSGGLARGAGWLSKGPLPERMLDNRQTRAFEELTGIQSGRTFGTRLTTDRGEVVSTIAGGASGGPLIGTLVVPVPEHATVDETLDAVLTRVGHEARGGRFGRG